MSVRSQCLLGALLLGSLTSLTLAGRAVAQIENGPLSRPRRLAAAVATGGPGSPVRRPLHGRTGSFGATVSGAVHAMLRGSAESGSSRNGGENAPQVITLGAYSEAGALLLTLWGGVASGPGSYEIVEDSRPDQIHVSVLTGSPAHPTGSFLGWSGRVTITDSTPEGVSGYFEIHARGFLASDPDSEDREVLVKGWFSTAGAGTN